MQIQTGFAEIVTFALYWGVAALMAEALIEILLTAGPLEQIRAYFSRKFSFIADLLSCGYCFSVWVCFSFAWVLPSPMDLGESFGITNVFVEFVNDYLWWLVNGLVLHRLSNIIHTRVTNIPEIEVLEDG